MTSFSRRDVFELENTIVPTGHSRLKNGVASLAYDPAVNAEVRLEKPIGASDQAFRRMDCRVRLGNDELDSFRLASGK